MNSIICLDPSCPFESPINPTATNTAGERALLVGVLERGIKDAAGLFDIAVQDQGTKTREATDWLMSEEIEVMSFEWICEHLDFDPHQTRENALIYIEEFRAGNREHIFEYRRRSCAT